MLIKVSLDHKFQNYLENSVFESTKQLYMTPKIHNEIQPT